MVVQSRDELRQRVVSVLAVKARREPHEIPLDESLERLGFESMDVLDVLFALEDELNLSIPTRKPEASRPSTSCWKCWRWR